MESSGRIKTALEIAMEKSANLQIDEKKMQAIALTKAAQKLLTELLNEDSIYLDEKILSYSKDDRPTILAALETSLLNQLQLPQSNATMSTLEKCLNALFQIKAERAAPLIQRLQLLLRQYAQQKDQILERLKEEIAPALQHMQRQLAGQLGGSINMTPEMHPEFVKRKEEFLRQFDGQFNQELNRIKQQIKQAPFAF